MNTGQRPPSRRLYATLRCKNGQPAYGYMEGTSMACPHVSGVAASGLAYAAKTNRHYRAADFVALMKKSVKDLDSHYQNGATKTYYMNHTTVGASPRLYSSLSTSARWVLV